MTKRVRIDIFYRDASNYKLSGSRTFAGPLVPSDVSRLQQAMAPGLGFVPSAVGIDHLAFEPGVRSEDDHPWHEITTIATEDGEAEDPRTFAQFVDEFAVADWEHAGLEWSIATPVAPCDDDMDEAA